MNDLTITVLDKLGRSYHDRSGPGHESEPGLFFWEHVEAMGNLVVIGAQWGDEGKGKIVDILARDVDAVVRYQGGPMRGTP